MWGEKSKLREKSKLPLVNVLGALLGLFVRDVGDQWGSVHETRWDVGLGKESFFFPRYALYRWWAPLCKLSDFVKIYAPFRRPLFDSKSR